MLSSKATPDTGPADAVRQAATLRGRQIVVVLSDGTKRLSKLCDVISGGWRCPAGFGAAIRCAAAHVDYVHRTFDAKNKYYSHA